MSRLLRLRTFVFILNVILHSPWFNVSCIVQLTSCWRWRATYVENFLFHIATFSQFQMYWNVIQYKVYYFLIIFIRWYHTDAFERRKKATNRCVRFGHSLWSANQLPAQGDWTDSFEIISLLVDAYQSR